MPRSALPNVRPYAASSSHTVALLITLASLVACGRQDSTVLPAADVMFSVKGGAVTGPDSVSAGWTRVRVQEDGAGHIVVIFRLPAAATDADVASFVAALDSAPDTPAPGLALGGSEVGDVGDVVLQLTPGRYVLGCVRRGPDGHRHTNAGESKALWVTEAPVSAGHDVPPVATQELQMVDFAYVGPERWPAGSHMLRLQNGGRQNHQLRLVRLHPGSSLQVWMNADDPGDHATPIVGMARLGPGAVAYLPVDLPAGAYVAYCLIADPISGREHVKLGMLRAIHVE